MKFEKINDNILKVVVNYDELPEYASIQDLLSDTCTARNSLLSLLDKADSIIGFDTRNHKVKIHAQALNNGKFAFTFTRLVASDKRKAKVKPKKILKVNASQSDFAIYRFDCLNDFEDFCLCLQSKNVLYLNRLCKCSVLYSYADSYYLVLDGLNEKHKYIGLFYSSITEFGSFFTNRRLFKSTLKERGSLVLENNALVTGQKFFKRPY